jgi:hypothetical protein
MALPEPCSRCAFLGGNFTDYRGGGMRRCDCARGRALAALDEARKQGPHEVEPQISSEMALGCVAMLGAMGGFFPADAAARMVIADEFQSMCNNAEEALWLAKRMLQLFQSWPGFPALRAVYCSKFLPLDGLMAVGICKEYPDGIPAAVPVIEPPLLALPPGHVATADPELDAGIQDAFKPRPLRRISSRPADPFPVNPNFQPVTQSDIDAAVSELRDKQARDALREQDPNWAIGDDGIVH